MKLLLDANLSWRLVPKLTPYFSEVVHIDLLIQGRNVIVSIAKYSHLEYKR